MRTQSYQYTSDLDVPLKVIPRKENYMAWHDPEYEEEWETASLAEIRKNWTIVNHRREEQRKANKAKRFSEKRLQKMKDMMRRKEIQEAEEKRREKEREEREAMTFWELALKDAGIMRASRSNWRIRGLDDNFHIDPNTPLGDVYWILIHEKHRNERARHLQRVPAQDG